MFSQIHFVVTTGNCGLMHGLHHALDMNLLYALTTVPRHGMHLPIEGLQDSVRTYARTIFQNLLVPFCTARYREKIIKNARTFDLLYGRI